MAEESICKSHAKKREFFLGGGEGEGLDNSSYSYGEETFKVDKI